MPKHLKIPSDLQKRVYEAVAPKFYDKKSNVRRKLLKYYGKNIYVLMWQLTNDTMGYGKIFTLLEAAGLNPVLTFEEDSYGG